MKKLAILLLLVSCVPIVEVGKVPEVIEEPVEELPIEAVPMVFENIGDYVITKSAAPFSFVSSDAIRDNFGIINVVRYDARYQSEVTVLVHVFDFNTRTELDVVLQSEFDEIIAWGLEYYGGHNIALYLTQVNHRVAIWSSGKVLVYVDTFHPSFAAREIVDAYLVQYPSDLEAKECRDFDGPNHFVQGITTRVKVGNAIEKWTDVCLRDYAPYHDGQYVLEKRISEEHGLLEGRCGIHLRQPGFISEYECPRGCHNGACDRS